MNQNAKKHGTIERPIRRRTLFVIACLATLLALFYTVEKVRGRRAWENCRRELEAKGTSLDWGAYIPPPVPDEQNMFKVPKMAEWFVRESLAGRDQPTNSTSKRAIPPVSGLPPYGSTNPVLIADLKVVLSGSPDSFAKTNTAWQFDSAETRADADRLLSGFIGQTAPGQQGSFIFVKHPLNQNKATQISVQADRPTTVESIRGLFPGDKQLPGISRLRVQSSGSDSFQVWLIPPAWIGASNYLAWTEQSISNLELIRKALDRPYARMDGDYQHPFARPIPNFVMIRNVAQALAQRSECYLLIGQPEEALRDLTMLHDLSRLLTQEPTGKPIILVGAMIHVAISGLYAATVAEGLRLQGWREPELAAIQQQLKETNLLPPFVRAFETESAGLCRTLESFGPGELFVLFSSGTIHYSLWDKIKHPKYLLWQSMPQGWVYQNMVTIASMNQKLIDSVDLTKNCVQPSRVAAHVREVETGVQHFSPYRLWWNVAMPNYLKAAQTLARNQTLLNEAFIACALDRHHKANGKYPETLDALVPKFAEALPRDVINGQSLKYRLAARDEFVLYSVGWNEKDDGGIATIAASEADWVWKTAKP